MILKLKDLHLVFGHAARTLVDSAVFEPDDIVLHSLVDDLRIGPIGDLGSMDDVKKRMEWLEKRFGNLMYKDKILTGVDKDVTTILKIVEEVSRCQDIYIWTGRNSSEIIGTARVLSHLIKCDKRIYVLDFSNIVVRNVNGEMVSPKSLVQTASFQIKEVAKHFKPQKSADLNKWVSLWKNVQSEGSVLRILDTNGAIGHKQEPYFDPILVSNCKGEFQKAALVIAHTLVDIDFAVSDSYLNWRLTELAKDKKLEFRGQLIEIRDYEVRLYN
jgi:hypothetical protein